MQPVLARSPNSFSAEEIDDFVAFVLAGCEVTSLDLRQRVTDAQCIAFLRVGQCLTGVAGLKQPKSAYRSRVQKGAKFSLSQVAFPFELGWVFILPSARGGKLSLPLCQPHVAAAGVAGIFATSRADNMGMHAALRKLGFECVGAEWASTQSEGNLVLAEHKNCKIKH
jgi:hypothetical protein